MKRVVFRKTEDSQKANVEEMSSRIDPSIGANRSIYQTALRCFPTMREVLSEQGAAHASGVFAAGDCITKNYRQVTIAVAEGTIAALSAAEYLWVQK